MRNLDVIPKVVAVGCSALLIAGFVSYRAGAFDWLSPAAPEPTPGAETSGPAAAPEPTETTSELVPSAVLSSSKSAIILTPPAPPTGGSFSPPPPIIGGSKSIAPLIPPATSPAQSPNRAK